jgi:hypothetical protein
MTLFTRLLLSAHQGLLDLKADTKVSSIWISTGGIALEVRPLHKKANGR